MNTSKDIAQLASYGIGIVAALWALWTYHVNSRRERARWAVQPYEEICEADRYKDIRNTLDEETETDEIRKLATNEPSAFTDYLNFFELVAILAKNKQLSRGGVLDFFDYYLRCLSRHPSVKKYIDTPAKGFQHLSEFLKGLHT